MIFLDIRLNKIHYLIFFLFLFVLKCDYQKILSWIRSSCYISISTWLESDKGQVWWGVGHRLVREDLS